MNYYFPTSDGYFPIGFFHPFLSSGEFATSFSFLVLHVSLHFYLELL